MLNSQEKPYPHNCIKATQRGLSARSHAWDTSCFLVTAANFGSGAEARCRYNLKQDTDYKHCFPEILLCAAQIFFSKAAQINPPPSPRLDPVMFKIQTAFGVETRLLLSLPPRRFP